MARLSRLPTTVLSIDFIVLTVNILRSKRLQNPAQILPNLYLSGATPAKNLTLLKQLHINYILNLTGFKPNTNELRFNDVQKPRVEGGDIFEYCT